MVSDDFDFTLLRQTFLAESEEGLLAMEEALLKLEADPDEEPPDEPPPPDPAGPQPSDPDPAPAS